MKISELRPGQLCRSDMSSEAYVFIGSVNPHPLFPGMLMVIWWVPAKGYTLDALSPEMRVEDNFTILPDQGHNQSEELLKLAILSWQQKGGKQ